MRKYPARHHTCLIWLLLAAFLAAGLPMPHPGDVSQDGRVTLQDAILSLQGLAADNPAASFSSRFSGLMQAMAVMSGGTVVDQQDNSTTEPKGRPVLVKVRQPLWLISLAVDFNGSSCRAPGNWHEPGAYSSITSQPPHPPPRRIA